MGSDLKYLTQGLTQDTFFMNIHQPNLHQVSTYCAPDTKGPEGSREKSFKKSLF